MKNDFNITPSLEDYLEAIYFLQKRNGNVRVTDVAMELDISKPSVNKAINILKENGLVNHEHYGLLSLTQKGAKVAADVAKRHILLRDFLRNYLGVDEKTSEREACLLEHAMSLETASKLEEFLTEKFGYKNSSNE